MLIGISFRNKIVFFSAVFIIEYTKAKLLSNKTVPENKGEPRGQYNACITCSNIAEFYLCLRSLLR